MLLTTILVNYNTARLLPKAVDALRLATGGLANQIVIVDNASRDDSASVMKSAFAGSRLLFNDTNVGFGRANNQALPFLEGKYVLLLNTDAFVSSDTIEKTLAYMEAQPRAGIVGVKLVGRDGSLQPSCRYFPSPWNIFLSRTGLGRLFPWVRMMDDMEWDHATPRACDWVPGCYYMVRREVIDSVGLFDPRYFLYYEEIDHCLAAKRAGWEVHFIPDSTVVHIGGESAKSEGEITQSGRQLEALQIESELLYFRKNHGLPAALLDAALLMLADLILPLKRNLKGARQAGWSSHWQHAALVWSLLQRTHWASRPTR
jgi:hypothetical protein